MWICSKCGSKNDNSYSFCPRCGVKNADEDFWWDNSNNSNGSYHSGSSCSRTPSRSIPPYVWVVVAAVVCIAAFAASLMLAPGLTGPVIEAPAIEAPAGTQAPIVYVTPAPTFAPIQTPVYSTPQPTPVPVPTQRIPVAYEMEIFVTQEASSPYNRNFRDYSLQGYYEINGARSSYGEKHFTTVVSAEMLNSAARYYPGDFVPNIGEQYVGGYNVSSKVAYVIPVGLDSQGRYYPMFIKNEIYTY